jgi:hypothetical protein
MYSKTSFTPGNKSSAKRIINYNALYNELNANSLNQNYLPPECSCIPEIFNKNINATDTNSARTSYNYRISQMVKYSKNGKNQFGNFYLGQPLNLNYLGRYEGMPGGSGKPPTNRF